MPLPGGGAGGLSDAEGVASGGGLYEEGGVPAVGLPVGVLPGGGAPGSGLLVDVIVKIEENDVGGASDGCIVGPMVEEVKDAEKDASVEGARLELVPEVL